MRTRSGFDSWELLRAAKFDCTSSVLAAMERTQALGDSEMIHLYDANDETHQRALYSISDQDLGAFSSLNTVFKSTFGYFIDPNGKTILYTDHIRLLIKIASHELSKKPVHPKGDEKQQYRFFEDFANFLIPIEKRSGLLLAVGD